MRILVVDDEPQIVDIFKTALKKKGHEFDVAANGSLGLDFIKENPYDLMFLDINMPGFSGVELMKYIQENDIQTKIVVVSGYEVMEDFLAKSAGAREYLRKPFKFSDIEAVLQKYDGPPCEE